MIISEAYLKDILCRVRSTDWEASVRRATDMRSDSSAGRGWYKDFMSKGNFTNVWSERLDEYLVRPVEWERMAFSSICTEIQTAPEDVRRWLQKLMDRYWMAAQALLRDVVPYERYLHVSTLTEVTVEDIPDFSDASRWGSFLGDSQSPEMDDVDEKAIVLRMLAIQELKKRLFAIPEALLGSGIESAVRTNMKKDGRKKLSVEQFEKDFLPVIIERLLCNDYSNKKRVFDEIAKSFPFSGSTLEKRYNQYRDDTKGKLNQALNRYGYDHLTGKRLP